MVRIIPVLAACAALAVAAGCGDDDNDDSGSGGGGGYGSAPAKSDDTKAPAAAADGGINIEMKDIKFTPATVKAKVGDKVTWTNDDTVDHNVVGGDLKSKNFGQGGTYSYTLDEAGTINYQCTLHPGMEGTIEVTK
jgi:plastocyanin